MARALERPTLRSTKPRRFRHTAVIAGLYVALMEVGSEVGLTLSSWLRDEEAWDDWSDHRGAGCIRTHAYAELQLTVDGTAGVAGTSIEVDLATVDQTRLRAKVARSAVTPTQRSGGTATHAVPPCSSSRRRWPG